MIDKTYDVEAELQNLFINGEMKEVPRRFLVVTSKGNIWCDEIIVCVEDEEDNEISDDEMPPMGIIHLDNGKNIYIVLYNIITLYDFVMLKTPSDEASVLRKDPIGYPKLPDVRMYA